MGILGKDLIDLDYAFLRFRVLFSNDSVIIEEHKYKPGELLTDFLNVDLEPFTLAMHELWLCYEDGEKKTYAAIEKRIIKFIFHLPLFRDNYDRASWLTEKRKIEPFADFEDYEQLYEDLSMLERYRWFLTEVLFNTTWKVDTNKYAALVWNNGMDAFTRGVSLGQSRERDPVNLNVQYEILEDADGKVRVYEQMMFEHLLDFFYVDLFKAIMHNHCPKPCKLCGKWFLQDSGLAFEYCQNIAPGETDKTCRDVGAKRSFRDKAKNNPVWEIHQRAYKKYYARKRKGKMTATEFSEWVLMAECLRDEMLLAYETDSAVDLTEYRERLNAV